MTSRLSSTVQTHVLASTSQSNSFSSSFLAAVWEDDAANVVTVCIDIPGRKNLHIFDLSFRAPGRTRRVYVKRGRKFVIV